MLFVDYAPIDDCENSDTFGEICVQCNRCERFYPNKPVISTQAAINRCKECSSLIRGGNCGEHPHCAPIDRIELCPKNGGAK